MIHPDDQYYLIFAEDDDDDAVYLMPDEHTAERKFRIQPLLPGRPLVFKNGFPESYASGEKEKLTDIMFEGKNVMVTDRVYQLLIQYETIGADYYPAMYRDISGNLHEGYWYVKFLEALNVCDMKRSTYDDEFNDEETGEPILDTFALDPTKLAAIPEEHRLIFELGGIQNPCFLVHERLKTKLQAMNVTGVVYFLVRDFKEGMQM